MGSTIADLKIGECGIIEDFSLNAIPLKLLEMGCLPGQEVELLQVAPFKDPLYIKVNGSYLAIRIETAEKINIIRL
ncbi:FeoA family protein [Lutibacter sp.]|uniref:FeoA family protein n=1 Tax=Lutibacter sp. TaxID=1925666 RepID=UPI0025C0D1F5|nr:FeoA family protein [Lutibacter sp.]MCF6181249.1 ferrous iron transport protein A [Lutibacter sp.]